jgi:hypothetical protein
MDGLGITEIIKKLIEMPDHFSFTPDLKISMGAGKRKKKAQA